MALFLMTGVKLLMSWAFSAAIDKEASDFQFDPLVTSNLMAQYYPCDGHAHPRRHRQGS